jgi:hypothetical protein
MQIHINVYRSVELRLQQEPREPHLGPYRELRLPLCRLALLCVCICVCTQRMTLVHRRAGGGEAAYIVY